MLKLPCTLKEVSQFNNKCGNIWRGTWTWQLDECWAEALTGLKWSIINTCVGIPVLEQKSRAVPSREQQNRRWWSWIIRWQGRTNDPSCTGIKIIHLFIVANLLSVVLGRCMYVGRVSGGGSLWVDYPLSLAGIASECGGCCTLWGHTGSSSGARILIQLNQGYTIPQALNVKNSVFRMDRKRWRVKKKLWNTINPSAEHEGLIFCHF